MRNEIYFKQRQLIILVCKRCVLFVYRGLLIVNRWLKSYNVLKKRRDSKLKKPLFYNCNWAESARKSEISALKLIVEYRDETNICHRKRREWWPGCVKRMNLSGKVPFFVTNRSDNRKPNQEPKTRKHIIINKTRYGLGVHFGCYEVCLFDYGTERWRFGGLFTFTSIMMSVSN